MLLMMMGNIGLKLTQRLLGSFIISQLMMQSHIISMVDYRIMAPGLALQLPKIMTNGIMKQFIHGRIWAVATVCKCRLIQEIIKHYMPAHSLVFMAEEVQKVAAGCLCIHAPILVNPNCGLTGKHLSG